eukprot:scaffold3156_cov268-Chaetoceros_neogracile.AAC.18
MKGNSKSRIGGERSCLTLFVYMGTLLPITLMWLFMIGSVEGFQQAPAKIKTLPLFDRISTSRMNRSSVLDSIPNDDLECAQNEPSFNKSTEAAGNGSSTRRQALQLIATSAVALSLAPQNAIAGKAQIDSKSGELFSPKNEMLGGGGSDLARGIKLESRKSGDLGTRIGAPTQTLYGTRFITYLARFLLNYDSATVAWWDEQDFSSGKLSSDTQKKIRFAEYAESVEVGLSNYFIGPYGSYGSVAAAKAGLLAKAPAQSSSGGGVEVKGGFFQSLRGKFSKESAVTPPEDKKVTNKKRQGILNLLSLLQARYSSPDEKHQLAILFSLISNPKLQPSRQIKGVLGEADNGSVSDINVIGLLNDSDNYRGSSRHGGGYSQFEKPKVVIDTPPALGASYRPAKIDVQTKATSRILRIRVLGGGRGYTFVPKVEVLQSGVKIQCEATAILDREGTVESVIILDPGFGYGRYNKRLDVAPEVRIAPPKKPRGVRDKSRNMYLPAFAVADLEYAVSNVRIIDGGNGYILKQPPKAIIMPPEEDADWYLSPIDKRTWRAIDSEQVQIEVTQMKCSATGQTFDINSDETAEEVDTIGSNPSMFSNMEKDPLALLPSNLQLCFTAPGGIIPGANMYAMGNGNYRIPYLPALPIETTKFLPSPRYRAFDPIFGAIGSKPVTKSAQVLTSSEYTRLALSGGICTVIVRTALNPLELVKTKIQLKNDVELIQAVTSRPAETDATKESVGHDKEEETSISTIDVMKSMISMRGPWSLFQSADICFLASIVFGSLGFGATELFRRSFTETFFGDSRAASGAGGEIVLLVAAALACVLTSLAAAPFEILRVRSMGYVEALPVSSILSDFLVEKRKERTKKARKSGVQVLSPIHNGESIKFTDITKDDIEPLFSGFLPIVSRELPFAVIKFLVFDTVASAMITLINSQPQIIEPLQVGSGGIGLAVSAGAGAVAGIAGAIVSHPADLILTLTSSKKDNENDAEDDQGNVDWKPIFKDLIGKEGGILNLYTGFPARCTFFFLVIGLQFFLYDYAKNVFQVGSDDLTLVLDVFYAVRQGLP